MKRLTRREFTAAGIIAALGMGAACLTGCNSEDVVEPPSQEIDPSKNQNVDVYGPPEDFIPDRNEVVAVYGPPEWFEGDSGEVLVYVPEDE